jgi:hypothetical protein
VPLATVGGQDLAPIEFIGDALQPGDPGRPDRFDFGEDIGGVFIGLCLQPRDALGATAAPL